MPDHTPDPKQRFLEMCLAQGVLRFGDFTLKSGRSSPYFFNLGKVCTGAALAALGDAYAAQLKASGVAFDLLFGPAYKGIALAAATSIALARQGRDVPWAYNRKEAKDHGEGGTLVGAPVAGRVVIVDDVLTAGTAAREALHLIRDEGAQPAALLVALDRSEAGSGSRSAAAELAADFAVPVLAIATLDDLLALTARRPELATHHRALQTWREGQTA